MVVIIDYKLGNLGSIKNMLLKIGYESIISNRLDDISQADHLILPGVGSFDNGMKNLNNLNLIPILEEMVIKKKTPILGICLGMQLLTNYSEEGKFPGLGWISGQTFKFNSTNDQNLKVPHMGWNYLKIKNQNNIFLNLYANSKFYFAHSYFVTCEYEKNVLATSNYGSEFHSVIIKDNIIGAQFHPEKSHKYGMTFLKNFMEIAK